MQGESLHVPVTESSQVAAARRSLVALAGDLGMDETDRARVALIVTEVASNLVAHARDGQILAMPVERNDARGVQLLAIDRGPGLRDTALAFRDGFSTAGTQGTGLGAIRRVATAIDLYSSAQGLVLLVEVWPRGTHPTPFAGGIVDIGAVCRRMPGEVACGDAWRWVSDGDADLLAVVDGLGHGPFAATAATEAIRTLDVAVDPEEMMTRMHQLLRPTRGAAASLVRIARGAVRHVGVGNVTCRLHADGRERQLVSSNGIVGHEMRKLYPVDASVSGEAVIVLFSDGLSTQCSPAGYAGLLSRRAAVVAGVLFRDFRRDRDDATIVVARVRAGASAPP